MTAGLNKATNYYNRQEAWLDWIHLAKQAHMKSRHDLVMQFTPAHNAGWRTIDKQIALLRGALMDAGIAYTNRSDSE